MTETKGVIRPGFDIAVVGMAGKFPGAGNIDEFWNNLQEGRETLTFFSDSELEAAGVAGELLKNPDYVKAGGLLADIYFFDASFFDYTPVEAEILDPQIRHFHECAWEALEDAGYWPDSGNELIGVYAGATASAYWGALSILSENNEKLGFFAASQLSNKDVMNTLTSYKLNLKGPSFALQTACSTSLVGIHLACQGLFNGECDIALAGGVTIALPQETGYLYQQNNLFSKDGHNRTLDAGANGTVFGNGIGIVVLKRIEDAAADRDNIYAVIKGSAINNDGKRKAGFTAPSVEGQKEVIRTAQRLAEVEPDGIAYIEIHGTATSIGDAVEIDALKSAFDTTRKSFCALGSVKSNVGHLDSAAGIAGFIKTVLVLKNRLIPPMLHFQAPNPAIDFIDSPFYINTEAVSIQENEYPLRAGVSSFGVGGTNAHIVLEEAPPVQPCPGDDAEEWKIIFISAKTETALDKKAGQLIEYFRNHPGTNLADAAYTLLQGRKAFDYRRMFLSRTIDETVQKFVSPDIKNDWRFKLIEKNPPVVFVFSGRGDAEMKPGIQLYQDHLSFREEMEECFLAFESVIGFDIKPIIYPHLPGTDKQEGKEAANKNIPGLSLLVTFMVEYALARVLVKWGVRPYAMIGGGLGELTAACTAGVISVRDAVTLLRLKDKIMFLTSRELEEEVGRIRLNKAQLPYISMVTGDWVHERETVDRDYMCRLIGDAPEVSDGIDLLLKEPHAVFVKPGTDNELAAMIKENTDKNPGQQCIPMQPAPGREEAETRVFMTGLGLLQLYGVNINWKLLDAAGIRRRISLPTYPFERRRCMIKAQGDVLARASRQLTGKPIPGSDSGIGHRFYVPTWKQEPLAPADDNHPGKIGKNTRWIMFREDSGISTALAEQLKKSSDYVICVAMGTGYEKTAENMYVINPREPDDYQRLFNSINFPEGQLLKIIHLWTITGKTKASNIPLDKSVSGEPPAAEGTSFNRHQHMGLYSLVHTARAYAGSKAGSGGPLQVHVVTNRMLEVTGEERIDPGKSTLLAAVKVIPQEYGSIDCTAADIRLPEPGTREEALLIRQLLDEFTGSSPDKVTAFRGNYRWVEDYRVFPLEENLEAKQPIRTRGVYLITGGLGGIGLVLAGHLAKTAKARLILTTRSRFPSRDQWTDRLARNPEQDPVNQKIRQIRDMEKMGAEVIIHRADVSHQEEMEALVKKITTDFGRLHGVIHAAGIIRGESFRTLEEIQESDFREQYQPKVNGLWVLEKVLENIGLDFCLLMSSMSSILGGLAHAAYAAANLYMDAFIHQHNRRGTRPWVSVNWETCHIDRPGENLENRHLNIKLPIESEYHISPAELVTAFHRILSWGKQQRIIFIQGDLDLRINQWIKFVTPPPGKEISPEEPSTRDLHPRPPTSVPYAPPGDEIEEFLVQLWQQFFGIDTLGIDDDFFELGGDSLKAIMLLERIHQKMKSRITIADFFKAPTIKGVAAYIREVGKSFIQPEGKTKDTDYFPLSTEQRHAYRGTGLYKNRVLVYIMEGEVNKEQVEKALEKAIKRHEALRASFELIDDIPYQGVHEHREFVMEYYEADETEVNRIISAFVRPFDLAADILLRAGLIKVSENRHIFMADTHYIVFDQTSRDILLNDFITLLKGDSLPPLETQYRDFVRWWENFGESGEGKKQREYWTEQLKGAPVLRLSADHDSTEKITAAAETVEFVIAGEELRALEQCAEKEGLNLNMILVALYNILLAKLSGQEDIVIGVPAKGRRHGKFEHVIGLFANTLPLRNYPAKNKTSREFMKEVRVSMLAAMENQEHGFENYPFNTIMALETKDNFREIRLPGLKLKPVSFDGPNSGSRFDLQLEVREREHLDCRFVFRTNLFKKETIDEFIVYFKKIISSVTGNPDEKIENIKIIEDFLIPQAGILDEEVGDFGF